MQYRRISADCHLDMPWLPPELFVSRGEPRAEGPHAVCRGAAGRAALGRRRAASTSGGWGGVGSVGGQYVPGQNYRVDKMAETGLYEDGKKGEPRPGDPHLRIKDMERDGVDAEVIFGILGAASRLERPRGGQRDAAHLQRLAEGFLQPLSRPPDRPRLPALRRHRRGGEGGPSRRQDGPQGPRAVVLVGHGADVAPDVGAAVEGGQRRAAAAAFPHLPGDAAEACATQAAGPASRRAALFTGVAGFQMNLVNILAAIIGAGVFERYPNMRVGVRRERHRLDPLRARPHGLRVRGPLPRPD